MLPTVLLGVFVAVLVAVCWLAPGRTATAPGTTGTPFSGSKVRVTPVAVAVTTPRLYRSHTAAYWAWRYRQRTRQLQDAREAAHRRWAPTVDYALRLASSVFGVSYWQMRAVAWCESTHNPWAQNGRYKGLFQLGWAPFGFSPFDPVANALSAAQTVAHDGGWSQWECSP